MVVVGKKSLIIFGLMMVMMMMVIRAVWNLRVAHQQYHNELDRHYNRSPRLSVFRSVRLRNVIVNVDLMFRVMRYFFDMMSPLIRQRWWYKWPKPPKEIRSFRCVEFKTKKQNKDKWLIWKGLQKYLQENKQLWSFRFNRSKVKLKKDNCSLNWCLLDEKEQNKLSTLITANQFYYVFWFSAK